MKYILILAMGTLLLFYQNCNYIESKSISSMSASIAGVESINGALGFYDSTEIETYFSLSKSNGYDSEVVVQSSVILNSANIQSISDNSQLYLCLVKSSENESEYNPVGFISFEDGADGSLTPICMPSVACTSHVKEIDNDPKVYLSSICNDSLASQHLTADQVLQLVKRY